MALRIQDSAEDALGKCNGWTDMMSQARNYATMCPSRRLLCPGSGLVTGLAADDAVPTESPHGRRREPMPELRNGTIRERLGRALPPLPDVPGDDR
jgi:hypothetical protein